MTAEYFPKKDRAFSTSIFNAGSTIGALIAPLCIPTLARYFQRMGVGNGWEMAFIVIGGLGFIWMGLWIFMYKKPDENPHVNAAELAYIEQDKDNEKDKKATTPTTKDEKSISFLQCFKYPQTWAVFFGKFMTDGVWWFFLFWAPAYISDVYGFSSDTPTAQMLIFVLYAITMLSVYGGKLPTIIINKTGKNPYAARMQAMFIFALFPLLALFAQPLGNKEVFGEQAYWFPIIIIGIAGAAHQSWSANIYSVVGDMVSQEHHCHHCGNRRYGGRYQLIPYQHEFRFAVRLCRQDTNGISWIPGQACRIFHHLLCMCSVLPDRLVHHEGTGSEVQTDYSGLIRSLYIDIQNHAEFANCITCLANSAQKKGPFAHENGFSSFNYSQKIKKSCKWNTI